MKKHTLAFLAPVLALLPVACGSSGKEIPIGPMACTNDPCGGDITGTWNIAGDVCLSRSILMMELTQALMGVCPGATVGETHVPATGSLVFNTDLSYSIDFTMTVSLGMNLPISCFPGQTCATLSAQFMQQATGDPNIQSSSCTGSNTCLCTITEVAMQLTEQGTYTVGTNNQVTQTPTGGAAYANGYCVKDATLTYRDAMPDPTNPVIAIVGTKAP